MRTLKTITPEQSTDLKRHVLPRLNAWMRKKGILIKDCPEGLKQWKRERPIRQWRDAKLLVLLKKTWDLCPYEKDLTYVSEFDTLCLEVQRMVALMENQYKKPKEGKK